jgi:hypothetical protein
MDELICCICMEKIVPNPISGWSEGHNAEPIFDGRCCDDCNTNVVVPKRIQHLFGK